MNVSLQSLMACPAFFNMLTSISSSQAHYSSIIEGKHLLAKFVELSRYFDPNTQIQDIVKYKRNVADAQEIF